MSIAYLERLFRPRSVAVIGAHDRPQRVGSVVMRNLLAGGFDGPIMPVNPRADSVAGVLTYPDVGSLPRTPDLAILCTPPETVPDLVDELGARGTRAALVMASGLGQLRDARGQSLQEKALAAAKAHGVRLIGGGTLGMLVPRLGLDASFSRVKARPGDIGFVSQSDAVGTLVLDWAHPRRVGFSHFLSLGEAADVGFGEALDYLGSDPDTRAILLYIESLRERRSFMAAARGAARNKPVLAIKAGRRPPGDGLGARLSADTLSLVEPDDIFDAALRRAGIVRVQHIEELFSAVETLARPRPARGDRLAVVSNGGGAGVMAADELYSGGLRPAPLRDTTEARLRALLPPGSAVGNPVDVQVDAPGARYADVLRVLLESGDVDALLAIHTPSALASSTEAARAVIDTLKGRPVNVFTCWMGGETLAQARQLLVEAGLAHFDTPADAVRAFRFTVTHERSREALIQTPPSVPTGFRSDPAAARQVVARALAEGRDYLRAPERMAVLAAYGIPVAEVHIAETAEQAAELSRAVGFPVELAVRSPDIRRKREVGGVALALGSPEAVEAAARNLLAQVRQWRPDARVTGFTVQRMIPRPHARHLLVGAALDRLFGPVILFGEGRSDEPTRDFAVGLPPLNLPLARELVERTRVAARLAPSPSRPAANLDAVCLTLVQISQLVVDLPEIVEMNVNPLAADEDGVVALGAFMRVAPARPGDLDRLAIRPYPQGLEERATLKDGRQVTLRPVRPEDEPGHSAFVRALSPEDSRFRFFHYVRELPHSELARLTQIDYDREMAFLATLPGGRGEETVGVVRAVADPDNQTAEFSVVVRSDMKRQRLATLLLEKLVRYCRAKGTRFLTGEVLAENAAMLGLVRRFGGFDTAESGEAGVKRVTLALQEPGSPGR